MKYTKTLLAVAAMAALTISCSDKDIFDKESYNQLIADAFPVKNIDPNQTWSTISSAKVSITLNQKSEGKCLVSIYDRSPREEGVKFYAKKTMVSGETYSTTINYPTANPQVCIQVTSPEGYKAIYFATIENGTLTATVGNGPVSATTKTRAFEAAAPLTRAGEDDYQFASDLADSDYPLEAPGDCKELPSKKIQDNTAYKITGDEFTFDVGGTTGVSVYVTSGTHTLTSTTKSVRFGTNTTLYLLDGATLITKNSFASRNDSETMLENCKIVICDGATFKTEASNGMTFQFGFNVYNRGTIDTPSLILNDASMLFNSGTITTSGDLKIDEDNAESLSTSSQLVNAGTITCGGTFLDRGAFYNDLGTVSCNIASVNFLFDKNAWINNGTFTTTDKFTSENSCKYSKQFINNCRLNVGAGMEIGSPTEFDNEGGIYVTGNFETHVAATIKLAANSIIHSSNFEPQLCTISGPSGEVPALIIADNSFDGGNKTVTFTGLIYVDCKSVKNSVEVKGLSIYDGDRKAATSITGGEDACTKGYTGSVTEEEKEEASEEITDDPTIDEIESELGFRYCYEDNFPQPGDYDMNDLVLDIKPIDLGGNQARYDIKLVAVGATKQLAGALCLRNISNSEISSISYPSGTTAMFDWDDSPAQSYDMIRGYFADSKPLATYTSYPVIFLFNDAHYAMLRAYDGETGAADGSRWRPFINTVKNSILGVGQEAITDVDPVECSLIVEFTSVQAKEKALLASNMDPFIVETTNGIAWEVHTFNYKTDYVLYDYDDMDNYSGEMATWAIQVDDSFKYPREFINIANAVSADEPYAYQYFSNWAADMNSYADWYNYPTNGQVYE